jgi:hypothetical protein
MIVWKLISKIVNVICALTLYFQNDIRIFTTQVTYFAASADITNSLYFDSTGYIWLT